MPCPCKPGCDTTYLYETVLKRRRDGKTDVSCGRSGEDIPIESLLSGARRPQTEEGIHAFRSEMRRRFTQQLRAMSEQMEKTCPSVFTLLPSQGFKQLDTWMESHTKEEELELALYCEHDSGWHATRQSLYRFRLDQEWLEVVKDKWSALVRVTKYVAPLAKIVGKAIPGAELATAVIEHAPELSTSPLEPLSKELGERTKPEIVDIELRYVLERLIGYLDSQRTATEPKNGGLHREIVEDGRLLWLCPDHVKQYQKRR